MKSLGTSKNWGVQPLGLVISILFSFNQLGILLPKTSNTETQTEVWCYDIEINALKGRLCKQGFKVLFPYLVVLHILPRMMLFFLWRFLSLKTLVEVSRFLSLLCPFFLEEC